MGKKHLQSVNLEETKRESIVVTGEFLSNKTIFQAFNSLLQGDYTLEVAYQLEKLGRRLNVLQAAFDKRTKEVVNKYAALDEQGAPKKKMEPKILSNGETELAPVKKPDGSIEKDANGAPVMAPVMIPVDFEWKQVEEKNDLGEVITTPGNELAEIEFMNMGEETHTIDVYKFDRNDFFGAKLKVAQWMSINCILANPYDIEDKD